MRLNVVEALPKDAVSLAPRLRPEDAREITSASGMPPEENLIHAIRTSRLSYSILAGDTVIGMFGVADHYVIRTYGVIWFVASDEIKRHAIEVMRRCSTYVNVFLDYYAALGNCVDMRNQMHIKWIKRMGFQTLGTHESWGRDGLPFLEFVKVKEIQSCVK